MVVEQFPPMAREISFRGERPLVSFSCLAQSRWAVSSSPTGGEGEEEGGGGGGSGGEVDQHYVMP